MKNRNRPILTARELAAFLLKHPDSPVYAAISLLNIDEPEATQEFVDWENVSPVVAVEFGSARYTIGFVG